MVLAAALIVLQAPKGFDVALNPERSAVLARISTESMKGHLSFLASDALEGRGTPSRGLDVAAEYIAAQFRRSGLEPALPNSFFQVSKYKDADVRNVIGVLKGSDPKLQNTYVLVTAHYDHLGMKDSGDGDRIYNGACDDGSGTVSVIELASVLSQMKTKPKRSIVFMAFWGEERGLLGSRYYVKNPVFPLEKTVADINIEQVGRTDDSEGPRINAISMTGQDYSDIGPIFEAAGKTLGTGVQKHPRYSDWYFGASDNQAFADRGVPAHTICTAFEFPDYHRVGDEWQKIDFDNMAKVTKLVALGIISIANSDREPNWNDKNAKTQRYRKARAQSSISGS